MDRSLSKHKIQIRFGNYEVDWQGIVHNLHYLHYFKIGRIEYLKHLGLPVDLKGSQSDLRVVLVRSDIDYRSPVRFDDLLDVYSRVVSIGKTSFTFEAFVKHAATKKLIAENFAIHVWLDPATDQPAPEKAGFKRFVSGFEDSSVNVFVNSDTG